jgi:hypothetical protein
LGKKKSATGDVTGAKQGSYRARAVRDIGQHADRELRRAFREICDALIERARGGGLAEIRLLLQMGQSRGPGREGAGGRPAGRSLGELLMDELKRRQDTREADEEQQTADEPGRDGGDSEAERA